MASGPPMEPQTRCRCLIVATSISIDAPHVDNEFLEPVELGSGLAAHLT